MMTMTMTHLLEIEARVSLVTVSDARPLAVELRVSRIMIRCAHLKGHSVRMILSPFINGK